MYKSPQLQFVGPAQSVVQGISAIGGDFMGQSEDNPVEYYEDE